MDVAAVVLETMKKAAKPVNATELAKPLIRSTKMSTILENGLA